jgi:hypothetical protein
MPSGEELRNNLAHAQGILTSDWDTIIQLCEFITRQSEEMSAIKSQQHTEN